MVGGHVAEQVDTLDDVELLGLLAGRAKKQAGLETVELVLGVEVGREAGAGAEELTEHQVEPAVRVENCRGRAVT